MQIIIQVVIPLNRVKVSTLSQKYLRARYSVVVIPLNRVKVSTIYIWNRGNSVRRNPLKSGQGFNLVKVGIESWIDGRNPLKSGQGFNL